MRIVALYHPNAEFARLVEDYVRDYERRSGFAIELVSLDTTDGADMARLYDIVRYPAILALRDDAQLIQSWQGEVLPLMGELDAAQK